MITQDDFEVLPFSRQCDFITVFADYIAHRVTVENKYYLYYMGEFFVEVCYSPTEGKVKNIQAFKSTFQLDAYLQNINIEILTC